MENVNNPKIQTYDNSRRTKVFLSFSTKNETRFLRFPKQTNVWTFEARLRGSTTIKNCLKLRKCFDDNFDSFKNVGMNLANVL